MSQIKNKLASSINGISKFRHMDSYSNETHDESGKFKISTLSAFSEFSIKKGKLFCTLNKKFISLFGIEILVRYLFVQVKLPHANNLAISLTYFVNPQQLKFLLHKF